MNRETFKDIAETQLEEVNSKITSLKMQVADPSLNDKLQELIKQLEDLRDEFTRKYTGLEDSGEEVWDEMQKNIYTDIESFNKAFRKSGAIFSPEKR